MPMRSSPPSPGGPPDMLRHMLDAVEGDLAGIIGLAIIFALAFFA